MNVKKGYKRMNMKKELEIKVSIIAKWKIKSKLKPRDNLEKDSIYNALKNKIG